MPGLKARYTIKPTVRFKKDLKRISRQGLDIARLQSIIEQLASGQQLDPQCRDHELAGNYKGLRECHVKPDWLLIYEADDDALYLYLMRTGSHSELF